MTVVDVVPCCMVSRYRHMRGTYRLHLSSG